MFTNFIRGRLCHCPNFFQAFVPSCSWYGLDAEILLIITNADSCSLNDNQIILQQHTQTSSTLRFHSSIHIRDYAAAYGLIDEAAHDLEIKSKSYGDLFYSLYLDNPLLQSGPQQRFATGILVVNRSQKALKQQLLDRNQQQNTKEKDSQTCHQESWMVADLPSVNAAVLQYPCTNGFVSLLITSYKVSATLWSFHFSHDYVSDWSICMIVRLSLVTMET